MRATQLAICVTVCDQHMIPEPDITAGLQFTGQFCPNRTIYTLLYINIAQL